MEKIVSAIFKVESEGFQAMTELKQAPVTDTYTVPQAVLIKKENGTINVLDSYDTGMETTDDTLKGGLIGSLIGILGGPIGILLGGSLGMLTGTAIDAGDELENASMIEMVSNQIVDGEVVLIALEQTAAGDLGDKLKAKFNVSVVEDKAADVAEEIRLANEAEEELKREARAKLRETKKEEFKKSVAETQTKIEAGIQEIKDKFKKE